MTIVIIDAQVGPDRRLVYTLPPNIPVGPVKLSIQPIEDPLPAPTQPLTREEARRRLLAAGKLGTAPLAPAGTVSLSDAERQRLAQLFGGGPMTTLDLINLERGLKE